MRLPILVVITVCLGILLTGSLSNTDSEEPPSIYPQTGGVEEYPEQIGCPSPFSITSSEIINEWPIRRDIYVTQYFREGHSAIDLRTGYDLPIYAVADGVVIRSEFMPNGYGWFVEIQHDQGFSTLYAHFHYPPFVQQNQYVTKGTVIGLSGASGNSFGPHLHYEVRLNGCYLDPYIIMNGSY